MVPGGGVEPPRGDKPRRILSPLRLPVPPSRLWGTSVAKLVSHSVPVGFYPAQSTPRAQAPTMQHLAPRPSR